MTKRAWKYLVVTMMLAFVLGCAFGGVSFRVLSDHMDADVAMAFSGVMSVLIGLAVGAVGAALTPTE